MKSTKESIEIFTLPYLPFKEDALEPFISRKTMEVHYHKHHKGYVDKLNKAIAGTDLEDYSLKELLETVAKLDDSIRNNAGGHYNHTLFWRILSADKTKPYGKFLNQLEAAFGSVKSFKEQFKKVATTHFGSGWAWLVLNPNGILEINSTPNQDNPLMTDANFNGYPLLGLDMWEHAYYLDYQNKKADYVDAFWNILDWSEVSNRYEESLLLYNSLKS